MGLCWIVVILAGLWVCPVVAQDMLGNQPYVVRIGATSNTLVEQMRVDNTGLVSASAFAGDGSQLTNVVTGYTGPLISGSKTGNDCMDAGGRPTAIAGGYVCQFGAGVLGTKTVILTTVPDCPTGWTAYNNWSRTVVTSCSGLGCSSCNTGSHNVFANTAPETCTYKIKNPTACTGNSTCTADYFSMGCI